MSATAEHSPRNWFTPGVYPSCACGFTPRDNFKLNKHWADLGFKWVDVRGTLRCIKLDPTATTNGVTD